MHKKVFKVRLNILKTQDLIEKIYKLFKYTETKFI